MKKKIWLTLAGALSVAFAAAAIDIDGYNIFDQANGENVLCRADPYCRGLTPGEIDMAQGFFGDRIDYKHVKIFTRPIVLTGKPEGTIARMWNGNLYIYAETAKAADYSKTDNMRARKAYLHEMTHVWQYKNDPKFIESGMFALWMHDFDYLSLYPYAIDDHKYFNGFNFEQQASIVENYYELRDDFRKETHYFAMKRPADYTRGFNRKVREECRVLDQYMDVLSSALPALVREPKCGMYRPYQTQTPFPASDDPAP